MKTWVHLWWYLAQFFLEWEMFQAKIAEKIITHIFMFNNALSIYGAVYEIMWKYVVQAARQDTDENKAHALWTLDK